MDRPKRAIGLLSGGLDSAIAFQLALAEGWEILFGLTFDYGQKAARKELHQAQKQAEHFSVGHRTLCLPWFKQFGRGGTLIQDKAPLPTPTLSQLNESSFVQQSAKAVWVPNRNGVFIEIAAGLAEDVDAQAIIVGFNTEEAGTFPDNSQAYLGAINKALSFSTLNGVRIISPTLEMTKSEIVTKAKEHAFPLSLLWSCYQAGDKMCGRCESCMRLKRALTQNHTPCEEHFADSTL